MDKENDKADSLTIMLKTSLVLVFSILLFGAASAQPDTTANWVESVRLLQSELTPRYEKYRLDYEKNTDRRDGWLIERASRHNDPTAQILLAWKYISKGEKYDEAIQLLRKAGNEKPAKTILALYYFHNFNESKDWSKAMEAIATETSPIHPVSSWIDGAIRIYTSDEDGYRISKLEKNQIKTLKEGARSLQEAADFGHTGAQAELARCYFYGIGVPHDGAKAYEWAMKAHEQEGRGSAPSNPRGTAQLGQCYLEGVGVPKDEMKARELLQIADERKDMLGRTLIGSFFLHGEVLQSNPHDGIHMLEDSYRTYRNPEAAHTVGLFYARGERNQRNFQKALQNWERALEIGGPTSKTLRNLAIAHHTGGAGIAADSEKAMEYFHQAAELGDSRSMGWLAELYKNQGNRRESLRWAKKAMEGEDGRGSYIYAQSYWDLHGVDKDRGIAVALYRKALNSGYLAAEDTVDSINDILPAGTILRMLKDHDLSKGNFSYFNNYTAEWQCEGCGSRVVTPGNKPPQDKGQARTSERVHWITNYYCDRISHDWKQVQ